MRLVGVSAVLFLTQLPARAPRKPVGVAQGPGPRLDFLALSLCLARISLLWPFVTQQTAGLSGSVSSSGTLWLSPPTLSLIVFCHSTCQRNENACPSPPLNKDYCKFFHLLFKHFFGLGHGCCDQSHSRHLTILKEKLKTKITELKCHGMQEKGKDKPNSLSGASAAIF